MRLLITVLALALAACAAPPEPMVVTEVQEVRIPYPVYREPPAWLAEQYTPEALPVFLPADHPDAVIGLDREGVQHLRALIRSLYERDKAWRDCVADH